MREGSKYYFLLKKKQTNFIALTQYRFRLAITIIHLSKFVRQIEITFNLPTRYLRSYNCVYKLRNNRLNYIEIRVRRTQLPGDETPALPEHKGVPATANYVS